MTKKSETRVREPISRQIERRQRDITFQARLRKLIDENRRVLDRLSR